MMRHRVGGPMWAPAGNRRHESPRATRSAWFPIGGRWDPNHRATAFSYCNGPQHGRPCVRGPAPDGRRFCNAVGSRNAFAPDSRDLDECALARRTNARKRRRRGCTTSHQASSARLLSAPRCPCFWPWCLWDDDHGPGHGRRHSRRSFAGAQGGPNRPRSTAAVEIPSSHTRWSSRASLLHDHRDVALLATQTLLENSARANLARSNWAADPVRSPLGHTRYSLRREVARALVDLGFADAPPSPSLPRASSTNERRHR